ncbi:hypothetical protein GGR58DRAFT_496949 [Xylaria digitata]|nr:hypothetical protein GGR58DRAFT_496949 [Xylaria digitata]
MSNALPNAPRLKTIRDWPEWSMRLLVEATIRGVWDLIDPDAPDAPHVDHIRPSAPTMANIRLQIAQERKEWYNERHEEWRKKPQGPERGDEPIYDEKEPTLEEITARHRVESSIFNAQVEVWRVKSDSYFHILGWIYGTIDPYVMRIMTYKLVALKDFNVQTAVRVLRDEFAPTASQLAALQQPPRNRNARRRRKKLT